MDDIQPDVFWNGGALSRRGELLSQQLNVLGDFLDVALDRIPTFFRNGRESTCSDVSRTCYKRLEHYARTKLKTSKLTFFVLYASHMRNDLVLLVRRSGWISSVEVSTLAISRVLFGL